MSQLRLAIEKKKKYKGCKKGEVANARGKAVGRKIVGGKTKQPKSVKARYVKPKHG